MLELRTRLFLDKLLRYDNCHDLHEWAGQSIPLNRNHCREEKIFPLRECTMIKRISASFSIFVCMTLIGQLATHAEAGTVYVSKTGNNTNNGQTWATAKLTVAAGLSTALAGDEVWVAAGIFVENITLKTGVALYGGFSGSETLLNQRNWVTSMTILDGNFLTGNVVTSPSGATATTRIDGFTIRNGRPTNVGAGIACSSSSPTISNNVIIGNAATTGTGGGILCSGSAAPIISNNLIIGNSAATNGGGVACFSPSSPTISNNTIVGNSGSRGGGIYSSSASPTISNNIIALNSSGVFTSGGTPVLQNNCIYNPNGTNYNGLSPGAGDISVDPQLVASGYGNYHLKSGSPCIDTGLDSVVQPGWLDMDGELRTQGAHVDIGADEFNGVQPSFAVNIFRVSTSGNDSNNGSTWALAKLTVQAAIDAAAGTGSGEVWVAVGTYNQQITLKQYVHLYGGFAGTESSRNERNWATHVTVLDGSSGGSVVTASTPG